MLLKMLSLLRKSCIHHPHSIFPSGRSFHLRLLMGFLMGAMLLSACGSASSDGMSMPSSAQPSTTAVSQADLGKVSAPDFRLQDQNGKVMSLAQVKGKVVVLTFWYTHCPDMCPLSAEKVHQTLSDLGKQASQIAVFAVSVDPANDTSTSAQQFSQEHRLISYENWHFLLGRQEKLLPVWKDYHIYTDAEKASPPQGQALNHMAIIYLIDKQGRERVLLPANFTSSQLTWNLNKLLQEA
jgi:protein SCO1